MKVANLSDVKNDLSRYVARVRKGERVRILVRGVAVADLVPVEEGAGEVDWDEGEPPAPGGGDRGLSSRHSERLTLA